jgi:HD superfamily phosphodiesterase
LKKILNHSIAEWGLFLHLAKVSKYVIQVSKTSGVETFMHPLAEEIDRVITMLLRSEIKIPGIDLSLTSRTEITAFINNNITPLIMTRKTNPPVLLLVMLEILYKSEFKPMITVFGNTYVKDFVDDFVSRVLENNELEKYYRESFTIVSNILEPNKENFRDKSIMRDYKEEFKDLLESSYKSLAHGMEHIEEVYKKAVYMNVKYNLNLPKDEILIVSMFHDIFQDKNRANHHILAHDWIMSSMHPMITLKDKEKQKRMALAVREHRASYESGVYSSVLSELLATADREAPDIYKIVTRAYKYQLDKYPTKTHREMVNDVIKHLVEKYGKDGYTAYTNMYVVEYGDNLMMLFDLIDKIATGKVKLNIARFKDTIKVTMKKKGK